MNQHLEPSQVLEALRRPGMDETIQSHLLECLECRREMVTLEALQAMALEAAPEPAPALLKSTAQSVKQEELRETLAAQQGDEIARQVFSRPTRSDSDGWFKWAALPLVLLASGLVVWWYARMAGETLPYEQQVLMEPTLPGGGHKPWQEMEPGDGPVLPPTRLSKPTPIAGDDDSGENEDLEDAPKPDEREQAIDRAVKDLLKRHLREATQKKRATPTPRPAPTKVSRVMPILKSGQEESDDEADDETFVLSFSDDGETTPMPKGTPAPAKAVKAAPKPSPTPLPRKAKAQPSEDEILVEPTTLKASSQKKVAISMNVPQKGDVEIRLFDPRGTTVRLLFEGEVKRGPKSFEWDLRDDAGKALPAGIYYLRVLSPHLSRVEPIELTR